MTLYARFEMEIDDFLNQFLLDIASNERKRPEEIWDFEHAENLLYLHCYDASRKYYSLGLQEEQIRTVLSDRGIEN